MDPVYAVAEGDLLVYDIESGRVLFRGRPDGCTVRATLQIPHSADGLVLLDYEHAHRGPFRNLLRCAPSGSVRWRSEMPSNETDHYTHVEWQGDDLRANSWSCYAVRLDLATGRIIEREFTK